MQAIRLPKIHVYQVVALLVVMCASGWFVRAESSRLIAESVPSTSNFVNFEIHPRVLSQLQDPRLGELANQLNEGKLLDLANSPNGLSTLIEN
ncbi:MAG: hypothetical protein Tsb005_12150 [Gammaproteobacteria bacterium]